MSYVKAALSQPNEEMCYKENQSSTMVFTALIFQICDPELLRYASRILSPSCILLKTIGNSLPYEVAVGLNGRIWVKGRSTVETIALSNAICSAEFMTNDHIKVLVRQICDALSGF